MATLDSSIVNIALPTLTKELSCDLYQVKWVVIAYLLVITCLLLPFGRLSDQYGRKNVFQIGFITFVLGSALCGFAPALSWLVSARVLQALGAAMLMANGPAIITANFPTHERGSALGVMAMVVSAGLISGPSIGGLLIHSFGWKSIFWVNIPVGIVGSIFVYKFVKPDQKNSVKLPFDWTGAILQTIVLLSFIVVFDPPNISVSGSLPFTLSRWVVGLVTLTFTVIFLKVEKTSVAPLLDLSLLESRTFWSANLAGFLTFVAYSSVTVLMPFFLEVVLHMEPNEAGIFMTAIPLTIFVVAPISGRLSDRFGSQGLSFLGTLVGALALFLMAGAFGMGINEKISHPAIVLLLCSVGVATGLFQSPNNNAIMGAVPVSKLGVASAMIATVRNLGLVTGTGLSTSLFSWRMSITGNFVSSLHFTHFVGGMLGIGAMLVALVKRPEEQIIHCEADS
jgi:EmrB/QacA subfamily drug resistance transporter